MTSYIKVRLDTTPPLFSVYAPKYTTPDFDNPITIESNEPIGKADIWVIDAKGKRIDYTLAMKGNTLEGSIQFTDYPTGITNLFVQLEDKVGNKSEPIQSIIEIKTTLQRLRVKLKHVPLTTMRIVERGMGNVNQKHIDGEHCQIRSRIY